MNQQVLIIGGGIGGLFSGAFLAKAGVKVTVLEKNSIIGGGLQCFTRNGTIFETGMHIMGGFRPGGSIYKICKYLGILDSISLMDVDDDCMDSLTFLHENKTYRIAAGRENYVKSLSSYFPDEADNIKAYVDELYKLTDEVDLFNLRASSDNIMMHPAVFNWSANAFIAHYIKDPRLQNLLGYISLLYGGVANHTPAYIHALISVLYINGPSRFVGGSQQLADALTKVITDAGGCVLANKEVKEIAVSDKRIISITTTDGENYTADKYISSIHPCELLKCLPEDVFTKSYRTRLNVIPNSTSAFSLFIKFKPESFEYINHTCYYQDDYADTWSHGKYDSERWPKCFMYMTPPDKNQGKWAGRMLVYCIMDFEQVRQWENTTLGHRDEQYKQWKHEQAEKILARLNELMPGFSDNIESVYAASPLTIRDYYHTKDGAIFGYRKDCDNILLSQVPIYTRINNLFLTGQNVNLHGICGVPLTAICTAEAILGHNTVLSKINEASK